MVNKTKWMNRWALQGIGANEDKIFFDFPVFSHGDAARTTETAMPDRSEVSFRCARRHRGLAVRNKTVYHKEHNDYELHKAFPTAASAITANTAVLSE